MSNKIEIVVERHPDQKDPKKETFLVITKITKEKGEKGTVITELSSEESVITLLLGMTIGAGIFEKSLPDVEIPKVAQPWPVDDSKH